MQGRRWGGGGEVNQKKGRLVPSSSKQIHGALQWVLNSPQANHTAIKLIFCPTPKHTDHRLGVHFTFSINEIKVYTGTHVGHPDNISVKEYGFCCWCNFLGGIQYGGYFSSRGALLCTLRFNRIHTKIDFNFPYLSRFSLTILPRFPNVFF